MVNVRHSEKSVPAELWQMWVTAAADACSDGCSVPQLSPLIAHSSHNRILTYQVLDSSFNEYVIYRIFISYYTYILQNQALQPKLHIAYNQLYTVEHNEKHCHLYLLYLQMHTEGICIHWREPKNLPKTQMKKKIAGKDISEKNRSKRNN